MVDHKVTLGLSIIYEKKEWRTKMKTFETTPGLDGILEYLVSTPAIIGMIVEASSKLLDPLLPEGYITVGKGLHLVHEEPTLIDEVISLKLKVIKIEDNRISMEITGRDAHGEVCKGFCERVIVMPGALLDHAYQRAEKKR